MTTTTHLVRARRFLPLFLTQLLNAFNDNLFKNAIVLFVVYSLYDSAQEEAKFTAIASALFILPFFVLSAFAGQLADMRDKARVIRIIKGCEVVIMAVGGGGLLMASQHVAVETVAIPVMLLALLAMGVHSTFMGPVKYAILPQHLEPGEVLAGTGLVEAGTYIAILAGTIVAGFLWKYVAVEAGAVVAVSLIGYVTSRQIPPAPPQVAGQPLDFHILRASAALVRRTMHEPRVFLAIIAISVFWANGTVLFIEFPPLAKNILHASPEVASLFLVTFSIGVALGSVSINHLLRGRVSARYAPAAVLAMALFIVLFEQLCRRWPVNGGPLMDVPAFLAHPMAAMLLLTLTGIAVAGGMFVVPLYAFLITIVDKSETARTVAANNMVNSAAMFLGALAAEVQIMLGVPLVNQLLLCAAMSLLSAWCGWRLYRAECAAAG